MAITQNHSLTQAGHSDNVPITSPPEAGQQTNTKQQKLFASGGIVGALLASSCCVLPLVLFSVGISGAWIGNLTALYPYKPYFVSIAMIFLAGGFYLAYRKPKMVCEPGSYCATPTAGLVMKVSLWSSALLVAAALAFPYAVPYLLD
ncbi:MAG: mercury transporter MerT [Magnetovibrio sp.]|nr:mercury transporter MerT [Magnetovibrio sp.]